MIHGFWLGVNPFEYISCKNKNRKLIDALRITVNVNTSSLSHHWKIITYKLFNCFSYGNKEGLIHMETCRIGGPMNVETCLICGILHMETYFIERGLVHMQTCFIIGPIHVKACFIGISCMWKRVLYEGPYM
jgi:hypothetical protein